MKTSVNVQDVKDAITTINNAYKMGKRDNGETYYYVDLPFEHPLKEFLSRNSAEVCQNVSQLDDWYEVLGNVLDQLDGSNFEDESEAHEAVDDQEPDVYTSDLTEWLNRSNYNVYWLDEALAVGASDGFNLLAIAQQLAREEIAHNFVDGIFALYTK